MRPQIVCLVGTALVGSTPELCRYADFALCVGPEEPRPTHTKHQPAGARGPNPYLRFATAVAALPCSVVLPPDIPLKVLVKVLTDARRSLLALQQTLVCAGLGQLCAAGVHGMCVWMGLPPLIPIHHAAWLTLVIVPAVALSMTFSNADEDGEWPCVPPV